MTIRTIRPDGTSGGTGAWAKTGTASPDTFAGAVADELDTTYMLLADENDATELVFTFANPSPAIPANSLIRSVTPRVRARGNNGVDPGYTGVRLRLAGDAKSLDSSSSFDPTAFATVTYPSQPLTPDLTPGGQRAWTIADMDNLTLGIRNTGPTANITTSSRNAAVYLDIDYNEAPVVAVTGPADEDAVTGGVQVNTFSRPAVTWTFTDPESDTEERWEVRIYLTPGGGWGGFDPNTTTDVPVAQSGIVLSSALTWTPTVDIPNSASYRAYVRAADAGQPANQPTRWSAWASRDFTMALAPPPVPTLAITLQPASGRVKVDITVQSGGQAASFVVLEYSDDAGVTWATVRGASRVAYAGPNGATVTVYDYESPPRKARQYRAKSGRVV